jgi:hypothetical protein
MHTIWLQPHVAHHAALRDTNLCHTCTAENPSGAHVVTIY